MKFFENKDISVMCPICRKFMTKADKRDSNTHKLKCKNCKKWIWFIPKSHEAWDVPLPTRSTSSGKRFY